MMAADMLPGDGDYMYANGEPDSSVSVTAAVQPAEHDADHATTHDNGPGTNFTGELARFIDNVGPTSFGPNRGTQQSAPLSSRFTHSEIVSSFERHESRPSSSSATIRDHVFAGSDLESENASIVDLSGWIS